MKSLCVACFLIFATFSDASAALLKSTFTIENVSGIYNTNTFCYCNKGIPDIPSTLSWSVIYKDTDKGFLFKTYSDGPNGIAEFGYGDDVLAKVDDFTDAASPGDFFTDALFDLSEFTGFAESTVSTLFGKTLADYDNTDENIAGTGSISGDIYSYVSGDAYSFLVSGGTASFQLYNSCASGGQQCVFGTTLSFGGEFTLTSTQVIEQVSAPASFGLFALLLLPIMMRHTACAHSMKASITN